MEKYINKDVVETNSKHCRKRLCVQNEMDDGKQSFFVYLLDVLWVKYNTILLVFIDRGQDGKRCMTSYGSDLNQNQQPRYFKSISTLFGH